MPDSPVLINRDKAIAPAMDYDLLMKEAIARVQELSGTEWTDYNLHDPGVTILQQLCYAITDPAYRTAFPIEEILADKKGDIDPLPHSFFRRAEMLTSAPVTANDYRKVVLDEIDDIENVWIEPVQTAHPSGCTKGVYRVFIQVEDAIARNMKANADQVQQLAAQTDHLLQSYRNIGEDFEPAIVLQPQEIFIKAEIFVDSRHEPQQILALMCNAFEMTIHPPVRFVSAAEMYINGHTAEEMYAGPLLKKGFVANSDLHPRKQTADPADLMKSVSEVPGVMKVKAIYLADENGNFQAKPVQIKEGHYPYLEMVSEKHEIKISSDKFEYSLRDAGFLNMYEQVKTVTRRKFAGHQNSEASKPLKGTYRNLGQYYSLQHYFPAIYGIGHEGLEKDSPALRQAQAKQLKAYLLFFEQLLANYLAQLSNMGNLFSPFLQQVPATTYATQPLYNVPHAATLLKAFTDQAIPGSWDDFRKDNGNPYIKNMQEAAEPDKVYQQRKNTILDHLLARFNLVLLKYPVSFYEQTYSRDAPPTRISAELEWKAEILRDLPALSANRNRSFNYREDIFNEGTLSGYENILHKLLHVRVEKRKRLTAVFDTGSWKVAVNHPSEPHLHVHLVKEYKVKDELLKVNIAESTSGEIITDKKYDYGRQSVSLLRYGLDPGNYRIVYDEEEDVYLVVYRHAAHALWQVVSREQTHEEAAQAQKEMIRHLKQISIASEGCYLLEHLLLKPAYADRSFGFRIYSRANKLLLQHAQWLTLDEREAQLENMAPLAAALNEKDAYGSWQQLQQYYKIYFYPADTPELLTASHFTSPDYKAAAEKTMLDLLLLIRQMKTGQHRQVRVALYVKQGASQMLQEDFFKFGMSIIFPSWPARFQYKEFRNFTEGLFREHTPVQFRMNFSWLGITAMQDFESRYFGWLKAMRGEGDRPSAATALLELMIKDPAFSQHVVTV
ncbi:hypothetical protein SAMN05660461_0291 [Chitinophaga ginsengisegetis]|uniref:Uncharacterized protein n=1 Tax=Chitinophaga ginsengisegetis TaxID=393003 RepID=A0A1T5N4F2_9BACT|nr:hypothetical protein [Chitinophaga ginsengisegetis]SKC95214.1 hypothetical protein SAMN05660461_0291 [Chitinophaga ginsengisegetis]